MSMYDVLISNSLIMSTHEFIMGAYRSKFTVCYLNYVFYSAIFIWKFESLTFNYIRLLKSSVYITEVYTI